MHAHSLMARSVVIGTFVVLGALAAGMAMMLVLGSTGPFQDTQGLTRITIADTSVFVRVADTPAKQAQGLSGTDSLPSNQGMLFTFTRDGFWHIWMKNMNYPLDVLWLSDEGIVLHIEQNLSPDSYPTDYTSERPARMVLELPAGFVEAHHVTLGSKVTIF